MNHNCNRIAIFEMFTINFYYIKNQVKNMKLF